MFFHSLQLSRLLKFQFAAVTMILWPAIFSNRYVETCGNKTIANALTVKDTSQTGGVWFHHLRERDLAYAAKQ